MEATVSRGKSQLIWGTKLFFKFILMLEKDNRFEGKKIEPIKNECGDLLEVIKSTDNLDKNVDQLNQLIGRLNAEVKSKVEPTLYAPFPTFSYSAEGKERSAILDQFDMVERTLTQASESKLLDWIKEPGHFAAILKLFSLVETGNLKPQEAMAQLKTEIEKVNGSLPEEFHLPAVNLSAYEI